MTLSRRKHKTPVRWLWLALAIIGLVGIILMWTRAYVYPNENNRDPKWVEKLILPFYFTFISNLFATSVGFAEILGIGTGKEKYRWFKIIATINMIITFFVYWIILFPGGGPKTPLGWASNMLIHAITPVLIIGAYFTEVFYDKVEVKPVNVYKSSAIILVFPAAYLVLATVLYYSLGADKYDAVYSFLRFNQNAVWISFIYVFGIATIYGSLAILLFKLSNPK